MSFNEKMQLELREYYNRSIQTLKNSLFTIFGENHKRQVFFYKFAGNTDKEFIFNELNNRRLVYFYITCDNDIKFQTNLWELMPQSHDAVAGTGIDETISSGGYIDTPLGFNLTISGTIKFHIWATTANDTKVKIVFHTTELVKN